MTNNEIKEPSLFNPEDLINPKFGFRNLQGLTVPSKIAVVLTPSVDISNKQLTTQTLNFMTCRLDLVGSKLGVLTKVGIGASALVHYVEILHVLGAQNIYLFGTAGALNPELKIGELVLCRKAWSDEGVSVQYLPGLNHFNATSAAYEELRGIYESCREVQTWTTDAPFRATKSKTKHYLDQGCSVTEMEASALFALAQFRGFEAAALFCVSDELKDDKWKSGFRKAKSNLQEAFDQFVLATVKD